MKIRNGFVSNSSSSSFVIISVGDKTLVEDGDSSMGECDSMSIDIDTLIAQLQEAKTKGITTVDIIHGGGYEG